jgi:ADP-dependent NAD(P)H-hydrate dehydratase / NAD(P)H-hydrate epimerase
MIPTVPEIRECEKQTIINEPIASVDLMERAGSVFIERLCDRICIRDFSGAVIFCGPGNNGGDGLVIARLLALDNFPVEVMICNESSNTTDEFQINLKRLKEVSSSNLSITLLKNTEAISIKKGFLVIDALFGIGISHPLSGYYAEIANCINQSSAPVIAVDNPSGLFPDEHTSEASPCICANLTITFQFYKTAYLLPENEKRVGEVLVADIGLKMPEGYEYNNFIIDKSLVRGLIQTPSKFAHKGSNGHGLLIAGSENMPGAAIIGAKAALRSGIGKVTVHLPSSIANLIPLTSPEALLNRDKNEYYLSGIDFDKLPSVNAIAVGPGIGNNKITTVALKNILEEVNSPIILDADALNILSENKVWINYLPTNSILTPHFKEFERLAGKCENDFDRIKKLKEFAVKNEVIVILKGAHTVVAMPGGKLYFNTTGNPGMATAGSGDALTGILLAHLARGYHPETAAIMGVYIHGLAADMAIENGESFESLIASDISKNLGATFKNIFFSSPQQTLNKKTNN